jgi:hypothetical protein
LLVGASVVGIYFYIRYKKHIERSEEEKRNQKENWIKDGGVEMVEKQFVWNPNVIGGLKGQLSVEIEEEKMKKNENWMKDGGVEMVEKYYVWSLDVTGGGMGQLSFYIEDEKEKSSNCSSSSAALLGSSRKAGVEKEEKEKEEKEEDDVALSCCGGLSTTSLTFLVDGLSCVEPFEKEVVDQRDTLLSFILSKDEQIHYRERMRNVIKFCSNIIPLILYILSMGEYRFEWLIGFGPMGIVKYGEDDYVVVFHNGLLENWGMKLRKSERKKRRKCKK